jgi:hypothetical protein
MIDWKSCKQKITSNWDATYKVPVKGSCLISHIFVGNYGTNTWHTSAYTVDGEIIYIPGDFASEEEAIKACEQWLENEANCFAKLASK